MCIARARGTGGRVGYVVSRAWRGLVWYRGPRKDSQAQPVSLYWSLGSEGTCRGLGSGMWHTLLMV